MDEKPGRNDPCYCGSGLKYKRCHLPEDRQKEREERELRLAASYVREDLLEFAQDERFAVPFAAALSLYWNNYYTIENADEMSENEGLRFFDWFAFDYRHDEETPRVSAVYREEQGDDLSSVQRELLESWMNAGPAAAYTLLDYDGQILHLKDFLGDDEYDVYHPAGRGDAEIGDLILARLLPVRDRLEIGPAAAYIPEDEIGDLRDKLESARAADTEDGLDVSLDSFLRRQNHILVHHALEKAEEKGRPPVARLAEE